MQKVRARPLQQVIADAHADARELNKDLLGFVRHLWTSGAPYYRASETVSAVVSQLSGRFVPQVSDIKQNIDRLIEKEYMARDAEQMDVYRYLA